MGYDVDCVCFSAYLSKRDEDDFADLFKSFAVRQNIQYGTFNTLAENMLNSRGNIRKLTANFVSGVSNEADICLQSSRPHILLIDEVDVFFKADFYGNMYTPLATLRSDNLKQLAWFAWKQHKETGKCTYAQLKRHESYAKLLEEFATCADVVDESVKKMIVGLRGVDTHTYMVQNNRIGYARCASIRSVEAVWSIGGGRCCHGVSCLVAIVRYKEHDGVNFSIFHGFKTMFAHFKECDKPKAQISSQTRDEACVFAFGCH